MSFFLFSPKRILFLYLFFLVYFSESRVYGFKTKDVLRKTESIEHVVFIGVDGLHPGCIQNATQNSNFYRLMDLGSSTLTNARTTIQTFSAPGWSSTLCSMRPSYTGVQSNTYIPPWVKSISSLGFANENQIQQFLKSEKFRYENEVRNRDVGGPGDYPITPVTGNDRPFPCVFQKIKEANPSVTTSYYFDWWWLGVLGNATIKDPNTGLGYVDDEWGCLSEDQGICDEKIAERFIEFYSAVQGNPSFSFVYFGNVDETGHAYGWCSDEYEEEIGKIDGYLGKILDTINLENTVIALTADHAGVKGQKFHSWGGEDAIVIPWMMAGPGIKHGYSIQYEVRNEDIVPTLFELLNFEPSKWWTGKAADEIFS